VAASPIVHGWIEEKLQVAMAALQQFPAEMEHALGMLHALG
jgi:hypothetical protein